MKEYKRYAGDPYWLTAKHGQCKKCGTGLSGKRAFYYPKNKVAYCEKCGESESNSFSSAASDEDAYNSMYENQGIKTTKYPCPTCGTKLLWHPNLAKKSSLRCDKCKEDIPTSSLKESTNRCSCGHSQSSHEKSGCTQPRCNCTKFNVGEYYTAIQKKNPHNVSNPCPKCGHSLSIHGRNGCTQSKCKCVQMLPHDVSEVSKEVECQICGKVKPKAKDCPKGYPCCDECWRDEKEEMDARNPKLKEDEENDPAAEKLFSLIKPRSTVVIRTPQGSMISGKAVMFNRQYNSWVLNCGGAHGTPRIASVRNIVSVDGSKLTSRMTTSPLRNQFQQQRK